MEFVRDSLWGLDFRSAPTCSHTCRISALNLGVSGRVSFHWAGISIRFYWLWSCSSVLVLNPFWGFCYVLRCSKKRPYLYQQSGHISAADKVGRLSSLWTSRTYYWVRNLVCVSVFFSFSFKHQLMILMPAHKWYRENTSWAISLLLQGLPCLNKPRNKAWLENRRPPSIDSCWRTRWHKCGGYWLLSHGDWSWYVGGGGSLAVERNNG